MTGFLPDDPQLIGAIARSCEGPILVIGGGPSVPRQLEQLAAAGFKPACTVSANVHGFKQDVYPVDYVSCNDATHQDTGRNLEHEFRPRGKPIITPCHFGDYRLPDWKLACNSGLTAIAVAAMLQRGDHPIVPVGFDFYRLNNQHAATYFHAPKAHSNSLTKKPDNFDKQIAALLRALGQYKAVRPLEGELTRHFKTWDKAEKRGFGAGRLGLMLEYVMQRDRVVIVTGPSKRCTINLGQVEHNRRIAVSEDEAFCIVNSYQARVVAPADHPLVGFRKGGRRPPNLLPPPPDHLWPPIRLPRR